ncbi:MAG: hypothetical protein SFV53_06325 [Rickettsiales bacterium]|nr:hypothetical protein [Rickettsiales bacterium]
MKFHKSYLLLQTSSLFYFLTAHGYLYSLRRQKIKCLEFFYKSGFVIVLFDLFFCQSAFCQDLPNQNQTNKIAEKPTVEMRLEETEIDKKNQTKLNLNILDNDSFYVGIDPTKNNYNSANIDKSTAANKIVNDRYYGYKFGGEGFYVAPEISLQSNNIVTQTNNSAVNLSNQKSDQAAIPGVKVKANLGYEFSNHFSGFIAYDFGNFSYNQTQKSLAINYNKYLSNSVAIGSQLNLSKDFGVKVSYTQQQFQNSSNSGSQVRSEIISFGTVYNF